MSRSLGVLTLDLIAKTSSFEQGMDRASRRTRSTTSEFEKAAAAAQKLALAVGAAAAAFAASSAAIVMNAAKAMDATSKMAQQIGVTTEALTGMRFAAQQFSSVSDQQFDQAMRRMTRRIEEAAAGSGAAKKALEEMGLSARALSQMTPDRQMLALADAMKRTESQASRLRYTMAIFDTEGMALVPALQQGAAAFEENIKLAERYGVVLSTEAAQAAEQFNTNLSHLTSMLDGLKMQLASEVLPTINQFITNVIQASTEVDGLHSEVKNLSENSTFKAWFDAALVGLARVADVAVFLAKAVGVVGGAFRSVAADAEVAVAAINKAQAWNWFSDEATNELQSALARRNQIVGGFNKDLEDLFTYQGNKFEQAALSAINTIRITSDGVKLVDLTTQRATKTLEANSAATKKNAAALNEAKRAAEAFRREQDQGLRAQLQAVSAIHQQAGALEDQALLFGLGKTALEDLTIARLEEQAAILRGFDGSHEAVEAIEREIEARQRLRTAMGSLEQKEAERQQWESWARDVEQIFDRVGQSLTDAIFDGGKSGKELLKDVFKGLTFNVLINPIMQAGQQWVTQNLGGMFGYQNPAQQGGAGGIMGLAQNASSLYSAVTGGLTSGIASVAGSIGSTIGSSALTSFAAGMKGSTLAAGLAGPTTAGATGAMGLGATVGAALPWIGGGLAIASLLGGGLFDREPTTRRAKRNVAEYVGGDFFVSQTDDRQGAGSENTVRQLAEQAVLSTNRLFEQIGIDAAIDSLYAVTESSIKGDRQGVGSGGTLRIEDRLVNVGLAQASDMTIGGFGGWSEAEMLPRLAMDLQITMLEAFQTVGDQLPDVLSGMVDGIWLRDLGEAELTDISQRFSSIVEGTSAFLSIADVLPLANLRDLSFDAAAALMDLTGGVDSLLGAQQSYLNNYYSEAERHEIMMTDIARVLRGVNLEVPDTLDAFKELTNAQNLMTDSGRQAWAALMSVESAFAEVAKAAEESANTVIEEARRSAEQTRAVMRSVTDSFSGLRETILMDQLGTDEARYGYLKAQADSLARLIPELTDQDAINRAVSQAESFASRAYGMLDQDQKIEMGSEFLSYVNRTEDLALRQIEQVNRGQAESIGKAVGEAVSKEVGRIVDAIARIAYDSGEVSKETIAAIRKLAEQSGSQVSGLPYGEARNGAEVNA